MSIIDWIKRRFVRFIASSSALYTSSETAVLWIRWLILGVTVFLLVLLFPRGTSLQFADMQEGSISARRIIAPFSFEILKTDEEYQRDREQVRQNIYYVFERKTAETAATIRLLNAFFNDVQVVRSIVKQYPDRSVMLADSLFRKYTISFLDNSHREVLVTPMDGFGSEDFENLENRVIKAARDLMAVGILDVEKSRLDSPDGRLIIIDGQTEEVYPFENFNDLEESRSQAAQRMNEDYPENLRLAQIGFSIIRFFLRPNLIYNEALHQSRIEAALSRVPLSSGFVSENEKIVDRNERITPEIRKKLYSLARKKAEMGIQEGGVRRVLPIIGKVLFVMFLGGLFYLLIGSGGRKALNSNKMVLLICLIVLLVSFVTYLIHHFELPEYLVPVVFGAMLLTSLFNNRIGYSGTVIMSTLVGALWGNEYNLTMVSLFVGAVGVITIHRISGRRQLVQTIFFIAVSSMAAISVMGFLRFQTITEIVSQWPYGVLIGFFSPIIVYGLLPLIETLFDLTTDFTLLELSNLNHPLLKRLSMEAPGTYHHSIIVGNLAESAAQASNANSLLARVGSYYHDVGKLEKSEYFVENQLGEENPHDKLTPRMSALILLNHVKRGVELAEKNKIPTSIKDIIHQHQGTSLMSFFYRKAVNKEGTSDVSEQEYRYPGPRPQTKEAAIVMLADVVEAATRTLKDPTHSRLKNIVEDLVDGRFKEGELNEAPLTLRDLEKIKLSFVKILAGIFHTRIEYPDQESGAVIETDTSHEQN